MENALLYLLQNLFIIDCLIIAVWVLDKCFHWNIGHLWRKWLWIILCIRMVFPVEIHLQDFNEAWKGVQIELEVDKSETFTATETKEQIETVKMNGVQIYEPVVSDDSTAIQTDNTENNRSLFEYLKEYWEIVAVSGWILGFVVTLFYHIFQYYFVKDFYFEEAIICQDAKIISPLKQLCEKYHIKWIPQLIEKETAATPMTFGYCKRKLVFPPNVYTEKEMSLILQHELVHIKYLDSWYKTFLLVVCDLYWFNPIFLLMKRMAYKDVEYVCDEWVTKNMTQEEKQIYGETILKTIKKPCGKAVPSMVQFAVNKKELKNRLNNLFEFKNWRKGLIPLVLGVMLVAVFVTGVTFSIKEVSVNAAEGTEATSNSEDDPIWATYYTEDVDELYAQKDVESAYITERRTGTNYFFIDEEGTLWGTGMNDSWQLGMGDKDDIGSAKTYDNPVKIAENVVHVDAPEKSFIVIWITEDGKLYGQGEDRESLLQMKGNPEVVDRSLPPGNFSPVPQLILEEVLYASVGTKCISVLTKQGDVYWWGVLNAATATQNSSRMVAKEPTLAVKSARYTVCGTDIIAAIDMENQLWLWGNNTWAQCGAESDGDYITEPHMAATDVEMVWTEYLGNKQNGVETIPYTTFIRKTDGKMYACGIDLGHYVKSVKIYGNMSVEDADDPEEFIRDYSPYFLNIAVEDKDMEEL